MSKDVMQFLAGYIAKRLGKKYGFCLLVFDFGETGRMNYVSNAKREDMIPAIKEFIEKTEEGWGVHKL